MRGKRRCRMHGGASTGPRTEAGLQRLRAARTTHGAYAAETLAHGRFLRRRVRRAALFGQAVALLPFLPPAAAARLNQRPPELSLAALVPEPTPPSRTRRRRAAQVEATAHAPWRSAIALARAARRRHPIAPEHQQQCDALFAGLPPVAHARRGNSARTPGTVSRRTAACFRPSRPSNATPTGETGSDHPSRLTSSAIISQITKRDGHETP
jgi:hypothetical protein